MEKVERQFIMVKGQFLGQVQHECFVNGYNTDCYKELNPEQLARYEAASKALSKAFVENEKKYGQNWDLRNVDDNAARKLYWKVVRELLAEFGVTEPKNPGCGDMYNAKKAIEALAERADSVAKYLDNGCGMDEVYIYDGYDTIFAELRSYLDEAEAKWKLAKDNPEDIGGESSLE